MRFDPDTVDLLFGSEDAEGETPERLKQYFVSNKAYENVVSKGAFKIVVGHKGVGKSALLRRAHLDDRENNRLTIWLQPSDFVNAISQGQDVSFNKRIEVWKRDFLDVVARKAVGQIGQSESDIHVGNDIIQSVIGIFTSLRGNVAGAIEKSILENFLKFEEIRVYIDDIDRGWAASQNDILNVSALINAVRDITNEDRRFKCRLGLRTDVYYLFRTSDESTDKIETNIVWLTWTNDDILRVIAFRIKTYFDPSASFEDIQRLRYQQNISDTVLSMVIEPVFNGVGHWSSRPIHNVLLSLCRARPRDLVKLLHAAAANAYEKDHTQITSKDLELAFDSYSEERLQDLINEFKSELPQIESLLLNFKPKSKMGKTSDKFLFTTDSMIAKINDIRNRLSMLFTSKKVTNSREILTFLYKIDFVTARKKKEDGEIVRRYFNQSRFLSNSSVDFGFDWEIHPAYRWALQPNDVLKVIDTLDH